MYFGADALMRAWQAGFALTELSLKTLTASAAVIGARSGVIAAAQRDPFNADHVELGRMVSEKVAAFSAAGSAVLHGWWSLQCDLGAHMLEVGRAMTTGRMPLPGEIMELVARNSAHGSRIATSGLEAATVALAPLHRKATANAKRLARRKRR